VGTCQRPAADRPHGTGVTSLAFSSDGARLASAGPDGKAFLWDVRVTDGLALALRKAGRTLTHQERQQYLGE
jgi:WD40 repeat protein